MNIENTFNVEDFRKAARERIPRLAFDYFDGGAEGETCVARNRAAFEAIRLVPNFPVDVAGRNLSTTFLGRTWSCPFGVAPMGLTGVGRSGTDIALARAAAAAGIPYVLSTVATTSIEAVTRAAPGNVWFQLYVTKDRSICDDLLKRAAACDVDVLVVTTDTQIPSRREHDMRNGFSLPLRFDARSVLSMMRHPAWCMDKLAHGTPKLQNIAPYLPPGTSAGPIASFIASQIDATFDWDDIARLREQWKGKLVVKGVLAPADAKRAVAVGADAVIVSNHGGRALDASPATIEALPAVVAAVGGKLEVFLDSGVRRGEDIARALALGARAAFVGRAVLFATAAFGDKGAERSIAVLREQFDRALGMLGCNSPDELGEQFVFSPTR